MPYTFVSPSGRKYNVNRLTPLTAEEERQILAYDAAQEPEQKPAQEPAQEPEKSFLDTAIPAALRIGGSVIGSVGGFALGGPVGMAAGGAAGSGAGEYLAEKYEGVPVNPYQIGVSTLLGAFPAGKAATAGNIAKVALRRAGISGVQGGIGSALTESAETGELPSLGTVAGGALLGSVLGTGLGVIEGRALRNIGKLRPLANDAVTDAASGRESGTLRSLATDASDATARVPGLAAGAMPGVPTAAVDIPSAPGRSAAPRKPLIAMNDEQRMRRAAFINNVKFKTTEAPEIAQGLAGLTPTSPLMDAVDVKFPGVESPETWFQTDQAAAKIMASGESPKALDNLAAEVRARAQLVMGKVDDLTPSIIAALKADDVTSIHMLSERVKTRLLAEFNSVQVSIASVYANKTQLGRALNNQKNIMRAIGSSDQKFLRDAVENGATSLDAMDKLVTLDSPESKYRYLRGLLEPTKQDLWKWYYLSNLLSSPLTQMRNTISTAIKTGMDVGPSPFININPKIGLQEGSASYKGAKAGIKEGWKKAVFMFNNGFSLDNVQANTDLSAEISFPSLKKLGMNEGLLPNVIQRSMMASDQYFRTIAAESAAYRYAYVAAIKAGHKYGSPAYIDYVTNALTNRSEAVIEAMDEAGRLATFQQKPGTLTRAVKYMRKAVDTAGVILGDKVEAVARPVVGEKAARVLGTIASVPAGTFIAPFIQTPANLLRAGVAYSPLGALGGILKGDKRLMQQGIAGTMATMGLVYLAADEEITGAPPSNPVERDQWYAEGKQPNSIKIFGKWRNYEASPFALQLATVGNAYQSYRETGSFDLSNAGKMMFDLGASLLQPGYLSGVSSFYEFMNSDSPRRSTAYAGRVLASLLPLSSAVRATNRMIDPTIRDPQSVMEYVKQTIPFVSADVPEKLDYEGNVITAPGGVIGRGFNPFTISPPTQDPLRITLRDTGARLANPKQPLTIKKQKLKLTPVQAKALEKRVGREQASAMRRVMSDRRFAQAGRPAQEEALEREAARARRAVRERATQEVIQDLITEYDTANRNDPNPGRMEERYRALSQLLGQ